jgi:hypothetical protein
MAAMFLPAWAGSFWHREPSLTLAIQLPMSNQDDKNYSRAELADISALADGSIDPSRRAAVQARIDEDAGMRELLEREQFAVEILSQARARDRASAVLRERIDAGSSARARDRNRRLGLGALLGVGVAAAAATLVLVLGQNSTPGSPSVSQAAQLALRGASLPAPAPDPSSPQKLMAAVGTVQFPNYDASLGATAVGERRDLLAQRHAVTVYYAHGSRRIAYTIVSGPALPRPSGGAAFRGFVALRLGGRTVVTWRRGGHTCVLSATGVPLRDLLALASWTRGAYPA